MNYAKLTLLSMGFTLTLPLTALANAEQEHPLAISGSALKKEQLAETKLTENKLASNFNQVTVEEAPKTRPQVLADKQQQLSSVKKAKGAHHSFGIYQAYSQLIEDIDSDGYFQTFSVTFDADVYSSFGYEEADVYAEMYLSFNGGPWIHYYTTDVFRLYGDSPDDEFEVYTTLQQGYQTGEYSVLIDLYEVGYSDVVASYSDYDSASLYALPLESADYDFEYIYVSYSEGHSGTFNGFSLALLAAILVTIRRRTTRQ